MNPEAIEAAAKAIFNVRDGDFDLDEWHDLDSTERERYECDARAALDAAAPYLLREARAAELEAAAVVIDEDQYDCYDRYYAEWLSARAAAIRDGEA